MTTNEQASNGGKRGKSMTHVQFHRACEQMKKFTQQLKMERPTNKKAAAMLSEALDFHVGYGSIRDLKEATGVKWESRREAGMNKASKRHNATRILTNAVALLYKKLNEKVPNPLQQLLDYVSSNGPMPEQPTEECSDE